MKQPDARAINEKEFALFQDFPVRIVYGGFDMIITVPKGFVFDGATVPRILWTLSGLYPAGLIMAGSCIHDWLYKRRRRKVRVQVFNDILKVWEKKHMIFTRKEADDIMRIVNTLSGMDSKDIERAYFAVRTFGWILWQKPNKPIRLLSDNELLLCAKYNEDDKDTKGQRQDRETTDWLV